MFSNLMTGNGRLLEFFEENYVLEHQNAKIAWINFQAFGTNTSFP